MASTDELTAAGLLTKDNNTLVSDLTTSFQDIYSVNGETLNFDSNTPDGQFIQIVSELGTVLRELITDVYNSCDPDKCVGAVQDNRYQINYLTRNAGAFTLQNIAITANKTVTLQGLDASYNDEDVSAYAVSDDSGNIWYLVDTTTIYSGTTTLEFRAQNKGVIIPTIGTITNQVTVVEGITNVINSVGATSIGYEQESDSDFRIRRARSTAIRGQNTEDTMLSQILDLNGVVAADIHVNRTNTTDSTSTPAHSIWVIVEGGANSDIAEVIYSNLGGTGTKGSVSVTLNSAALQPVTVKFDRATVVPLYIKFDIQPIVSGVSFDIDSIKEYIEKNLSYRIGDYVETATITSIAQDAIDSVGGNGYAVGVLVSSDNTNWVEYLPPIVATQYSIADIDIKEES